MNKLVAKTQEEVEEYRRIIFQSKEECRRAFAEEPFEKKIETAFKLYRETLYFKNFKLQPSTPSKQQ